MADTLALSSFTGQTEGYAARSGSSYSTGDLRRRYNFGDRTSELSPKRDPFFRFLSMYRKEPTDDPIFKFSEERASWHKRYAYVTAHGMTVSVTDTADASFSATCVAAGKTYFLKMGTDYKSAGNIGNVFGNSSSAFSLGVTGTAPMFFLEGQVIKVNTGSAYNVLNDYFLGKIKGITPVSNTHQILEVEIIKTMNTSTNNYLQWASATAPLTATYATDVAYTKYGLESKRTYVVGTSFAPGSGYPDTWADNPYSTGYGMCQIFKTSLGMDNSTRATVLKYAPNEWQRLWANKLIEHNWDIETALLFSSIRTDADGSRHSEGIINYILNYGQIYSLSGTTTGAMTKTYDEFLDDLSQFYDPRNGNDASTIWFCDTMTFNYFNKLAGFFSNSINVSPNYRSEISRSNVGGVEVNKVNTPHGDINFVRNVHLDGSPVKLAAINMNAVKLRPLVGNGVNRDTAIYVGVQTLENSGVDKRIDLIQSELGLECSLPETSACWK